MGKSVDIVSHMLMSITMPVLSLLTLPFHRKVLELLSLEASTFHGKASTHPETLTSDTPSLQISLPK